MEKNKDVVLLEKFGRYLSATNKIEKQTMLEDLKSYQGDYTELFKQLAPIPADTNKGIIKNRPFTLKKLYEKYPDELISMYIPDDYKQGEKRPMVLFLHGGGQAMARDTSKKLFEQRITDIVEESGFIFCAACAPYSETSFNGWNLPGTDDFIMDVIEEMESCYSIDPDRIFLAGTSMGGIGTIHLAHRLSDRFVGVFVSSSSWDIAYWPCLIGTSVWISQGLNDAVMFRRRHGTDIEFARLMKRRLEESGVECFYRENSGGHPIANGRVALRECLAWSKHKTRDPFFQHVVALTPRGLTPWIDWRRHPVPVSAYQTSIDFHDIPHSPHCRWVTVEGIGNNSIMYDMVEITPCKDDEEEDWNNFQVMLKRKHIKAGLVETFLDKSGVIEVNAQNVKGFTLWLHPDMLNLDKVKIFVNGIEKFNGPIIPNAGVLAESFDRRRDWGLLYPASITLKETEEDFWVWKTTADQIKLGR